MTPARAPSNRRPRDGAALASRRMPRLALLPLVLAPLAAAGCGGGGDTSQVRSAITALAQAREHGDAEAACGRLVAVADEGERPAGGEQGDAGEQSRAGECERAFARVSAAQDGLRSYRQDVRGVTVEGDEAIARVHVVAVRDDGSRLVRTVTYRLARRDGSWRVLLSRE